MPKFAVNVMGYIEDDKYNEDTLAEFIKLHPSVMQFRVVGVAVQEIKANTIQINSKKIKKRKPLFGRNKK